MLTNDKVSLNNLISIYSGGLKVATFAQIKQALIEQYRFIYGMDIDVDDTTADGIFINTNALIINNILQTMKSMYSNLDINSASGEYLDILCRLSNIERKPATRSNTNLQVTYIGTTDVTYTPDQLTFVDKAGVEWSPTQNYSFSANETKLVYVECKKIGPVTAPAKWIYQIVDASIPILVSQIDAANIGQEQESDFNLRVRQTSSGSGAGLTTLSALKSQLLSISGIKDVAILNNYTDSQETCSDNTAIPAHSIYIVLRQQDGVLIPDAQIGKTIYTKLTSGIGTATPSTGSGLSKSYEYFSEAEFESIANYMIRYFNELPIGSMPTSNEILIKMISADPKFKGAATYYVNSVQMSITTNPLEYFNDQSHSFVKQEDGKYILTIK